MARSRPRTRVAVRVDNEVGAAIQKEEQHYKDHGEKATLLIPLDLDGFLHKDEWSSGFKPQLRRRLAADFSGWVGDEGNLEGEMKQVVRALRAQSPPASG